MLSVDDVAPFLLERRLLEERPIVAGDVLVVQVPRRNHNFKVISERGAGYFLKQGLGADRIRSVTHEAHVYRWFESLPTFRILERFLPTCCLYDSKECTLVLALVEGSQSLDEYHRRRRRLPRALGSVLGEALGSLHHLTRSPTALDEPEGPGRATRFLRLHRPNFDEFVGASSGILELIRTIQRSPELCRLLDRLAEDWREDAVIHGDVRWDNCHVIESPVRGGGFGIKFVDWETAGVGDPCLDVGTVFSQCLVFWLLSTPLTRTTPPETFARLSRFPLRSMQPAIRSFWRSYIREMKLDAAARGEWLAKSMRYAGARLVQTAYEQMQEAGRVTADVIYLLQLSLNVLERPLEAAVQLLGIPVVSAVTP